jgi:cytochrome b6-f complex iron-sulfur subunit
VSLLALSSGQIFALTAMIVLDIFAIAFGLSFARQAKAQRRAAKAEAEAYSPEPTPRVKAVSRRDFFRASLVTSLLVFTAEFGGASVAFLWPNVKGGFGGLINAGNIEDIKSELASTGAPVYNGNGRFYVVPWEGRPTDLVNYADEGVAANGIMPLYQRCVHLGCRVPFCGTSKWFECPCHGSKYNRAGEYKLGPAPRGLDRFRMTVDETGLVIVDTSEVVLGPPRGTDTIDQPPQGPFCVAAG